MEEGNVLLCVTFPSSENRSSTSSTQFLDSSPSWIDVSTETGWQPAGLEWD